MTMGPYGVHWERTQTWWDMVAAYHTIPGALPVHAAAGAAGGGRLLPRRRGRAAGLPGPGLGARAAARPTGSATTSTAARPRRSSRACRCADGRLVLPDGMSYRVLVLPERETMTPALLRKVRDLVAAGATVIGPPPRKSPGLAGYPRATPRSRRWPPRSGATATASASRSTPSGRAASSGCGKPQQSGGPESEGGRRPAKPGEDPAAGMTTRRSATWHVGAAASFRAGAVRRLRASSTRRPRPDGRPAGLRVGRRRCATPTGATATRISTSSPTPAAAPVDATCTFRVSGKRPELWDAVTGEIRDLPEFREAERPDVGAAALRAAPILLRRLPEARGRRWQGGKRSGRRRRSELRHPRRGRRSSTGRGTSPSTRNGAGPERSYSKTSTTGAAGPKTGSSIIRGQATYRKAFDLPDAAAQGRPRASGSTSGS